MAGAAGADSDVRKGTIPFGAGVGEIADVPIIDVLVDAAATRGLLSPCPYARPDLLEARQ
jgi:hypothetical protein